MDDVPESDWKVFRELRQHALAPSMSTLVGAPRPCLKGFVARGAQPSPPRQDR